jgi:hypothetical protein
MAVPRTLSPNERPQSGLSFIWKLVISLLVSLHVIAVFVGPWATPPHSELARTIARGYGPYLGAAFLNNGYRFFAPEPGPGHLVHYQIVTRDGQQIDGSFPDKKAQWPRLLYHRYFMLSEFLNSISEPAAPELAIRGEKTTAGRRAEELDPQSAKSNPREQPIMAGMPLGRGPGASIRAELASAYEEAYAGHLAKKYDARSVKLYLQEHRLPTMADVRAGKKLSDPEFYEEQLVMEFEE